jgi:ribosomal protein L37AE/L43A
VSRCGSAIASLAGGLSVAGDEKVLRKIKERIMMMITAFKNRYHEETTKGGSETPCPFCGVRRVRRTSYIRCAKCGINWDMGEILDKDPRIERMHKMVADIKATAPPKKPPDSENTFAREVGNARR